MEKIQRLKKEPSPPAGDDNIVSRKQQSLARLRCQFEKNLSRGRMQHWACDTLTRNFDKLVAVVNKMETTPPSKCDEDTIGFIQMLHMKMFTQYIPFGYLRDYAQMYLILAVMLQDDSNDETVHSQFVEQLKIDPTDWNAKVSAKFEKDNEVNVVRIPPNHVWTEPFATARWILKNDSESFKHHDHQSPDKFGCRATRRAALIMSLLVGHNLWCRRYFTCMCSPKCEKRLRISRQCRLCYPRMVFICHQHAKALCKIEMAQKIYNRMMSNSDSILNSNTN